MGIIPSIMCYVPPSVERLGPTTNPDFKPGSTTPTQISNPDTQPPQNLNQIDATGSP